MPKSRARDGWIPVTVPKGDKESFGTKLARGRLVGDALDWLVVIQWLFLAF